MPFVSTAQQRWMYANKPEMAREWTPGTDFKNLPDKVKKKKRTKEAAAVDLLSLLKQADILRDKLREGTLATADAYMSQPRSRQDAMAATMGGGALRIPLAMGLTALAHGASAPSVYGLQSASRGALYGLGGVTGSIAGGLAHDALGDTSSLGGKLLASGAGGLAGLLATRAWMGKHPQDQDREDAALRKQQKQEQLQTKQAAIMRLARFLA